MTVTTTRLGPDQARLRAMMRRLAEATSTDAHVEIVRDHPELGHHEGVADTRRYRL